VSCNEPVDFVFFSELLNFKERLSRREETKGKTGGRNRSREKKGNQKKTEPKQRARTKQRKTQKEKEKSRGNTERSSGFAIVFVPADKEKTQNQKKFPAGRPLHHPLGFKSCRENKRKTQTK
jgi:hypothetical protein